MKELHVHTRALYKKLAEFTQRLTAGKPDQESMDSARIHLSARLLQISEFRFFQLAYEQWYGRGLDVKTMEHVFADYMMKNEIPHWARHFGRIVTTRYYESTLNPREYNLNCPAPLVDHAGTGTVRTIVMTVIYLVFYLILSGYITFS